MAMESAVSPASAEVKKPSIERKPKPIAKRGEGLIRDLTRIVNNPTQEQFSAYADRLATTNPDLQRDDALEKARSHFGSIKRAIVERGRSQYDAREALYDKYDKTRRGTSDRASATERQKELEGDVASLTRDIVVMGSSLREAGIQLDPSQVPLNLAEKAKVGVQRVGEGLAGVGVAAREGVIGAGKRVGQEVVGAVNEGKELAESGAGLGRRGIGGLLKKGLDGLRAARGAGESGWSGVQTLATKAKVETIGLGSRAISGTEGLLSGAAGLGGKAASGTGELLGGAAGLGSKALGTAGSALGEAGKGIKGVAEWAAQPFASGYDVVSNFTASLGREAADRGTSLGSNVEDVFNRARNGAPGALKSFFDSMRAAGKTGTDFLGRQAENAGGVLDRTVLNFTKEQAIRVASVEKNIQGRVTSEISQTLQKGGEFLAPAWNRIQKDREQIREREGHLYDRLELLTERFSGIAAPAIDTILDQGRDLRDVALGLSREGIRGAQSFGRGVSHVSHDLASPVWGGLTERWENLRVRSNDARTRINGFLDIFGTNGARLKGLAESAIARARSVEVHLPEVKIDGNKIVEKGQEVTADVREWFGARGAAAREFLGQQRENISKARDLLSRYWEIYAVGKWQESGLSPREIKNRLNFQQAIQAISENAAIKRLENAVVTAGSMTAATAMEVATDRKKMAGAALILGTAYLLKDQATRDAVINFVQHGGNVGDVLQQFGNIFSSPDSGNVNLPDMSGGVPGAEAAGSSAPVSIDSGLHHVGNVSDIGIGHHPFDPSHLSTGAESGYISSGSLDTGGLGIDNSGAGPDVSGATAIPDSVGAAVPISPEGVSADIWSHIKVGEPIAEQARKLAEQMGGNPDENYVKILKGVFETHRDNFLSTVEAMLKGEGGPYTSDQLAIAEKAKLAINILTQNPSEATPQLLTDALHFWRPM